MIGLAPIKDSVQPLLQPMPLLRIQAFVSDRGCIQKWFKILKARVWLYRFLRPILKVRHGFSERPLSGIQQLGLLELVIEARANISEAVALEHNGTSTKIVLLDILNPVPMLLCILLCIKDEASPCWDISLICEDQGIVIPRKNMSWVYSSCCQERSISLMSSSIFCMASIMLSFPSSDLFLWWSSWLKAEAP